MSFSVRGLMAFSVVLLAGFGTARAQDSEKRSFSRMLNVDSLIDNYARFLARKYDLNDEQDSFTQQMLREKTRRFLEQNQGELYDLVDRLFEVRAGGEMEGAELQSWGQRVLPIYEAAKEVIIQSNEEWRGILTEKQRAIHDEDLRLMNETFASTEDQLSRIVAGEMTVEEFRQGNRKGPKSKAPKPSQTKRVPGQAQPQRGAEAGEAGAGDDSAPAPSNPQPTGSKSPGAAAGTGRSGESQPESPAGGEPESRRLEPPTGAASPRAGESAPASRRERSGAAAAGKSSAAPRRELSQWEKYVEDFIQKYKLNDEQTQKARAILKDCQEQADRYTSAKKEEMERLDKQIAALSSAKDKDKDKGKAAELTALQQRRSKLAEPVNEIFEKQLKPRLDKLPTRAQLKAAEAAGAKKSSGKDGKGKDATKGGRPPAAPRKDTKPQSPAPDEQQGGQQPVEPQGEEPAPEQEPAPERPAPEPEGGNDGG